MPLRTALATVATLVALWPAMAWGSPPSGTWSTIRVQNNLQGSGRYFGKNISDAQVWLYLHDDSGGIRYRKASAPATLEPFSQGQWLRLSTILDGELFAPQGSSNGVIYAVISKDQPTDTPQPVPSSGSVTSQFAYLPLEWDFVGSPPAVDIQAIDQFSFPGRVSVYSPGGALRSTSGFKAGTNAETVLAQLTAATGGTNCSYPDLAKYPYRAASGYPSGHRGVPSDYLTAARSATNRLLQRMPVKTGLTGFTSTPYARIGPSKSQTMQYGGQPTNVMQFFGKGYAAYLAYLLGHQPPGGYYIDYSAALPAPPNGPGQGYSFILKVVAPDPAAGKFGYGLRIEGIRINTGQRAGQEANRSAGIPLTYKGAPISLILQSNGWAQENLPLANAGPRNNTYGLWTDFMIAAGAPNEGAYRGNTFGIGPLLTTVPAMRDDPAALAKQQGLFADIMASASTAITHGMLGPKYVESLKRKRGTNYFWGELGPQNMASLGGVFVAGEANCDPWVKAMWNHQNFGKIPGTSVWSRPAYLSTFTDRFARFAPLLTPIRGGTILWEIGVPADEPPATLPAGSLGSLASMVPAWEAMGCESDVDGNGRVDEVDLAAILTDWGLSGEYGDAAWSDVVPDGTVDSADLAEFLEDWGACGS
jgi:hypothetical protein